MTAVAVLSCLAILLAAALGVTLWIFLGSEIDDEAEEARRMAEIERRASEIREEMERLANERQARIEAALEDVERDLARVRGTVEETERLAEMLNRDDA